MVDGDWWSLVKNAEKVALCGSNIRKIHYKLPDGREMVEEYSLDTGVLNKRAWKTNNNIYKTTKWEVEVGDPVTEHHEENIDQIGIQESKSNVSIAVLNHEIPFVVHRITKTKLEWRIRNLPYEVEVYQLSVDPVEKCIVVRTTNKKYYKKIPILELQRLNLIPDESYLKYSHSYNTLIITYDKPKELISFEKKVQEELKNVKTVDNADLDCKQS